MSVSNGRVTQQDLDRISNRLPGVSVISVTREDISSRNAVEYTIYFRVEDGTTRLRADLWVNEANIVNSREDVEEYITGLVVNAIQTVKVSFEENKKESE